MTMATPTQVPDPRITEPQVRAPDASVTNRTVTLPDTAVIRPVPPTTAPSPARPNRGFEAALVGLAMLLVAAIGVIVWQQGRVDDASTSLSATETELAISTAEAATLTTEVAQLEAELARAQTEVEGLERRVERLEARVAGSTTAGAQTEAELEQTRQELAQAQIALATAQQEEADARAAYEQARGELYAIAGAPLADGRWEGRLYMVGGTQVPPMLAYDEMKLFQGRDAIDAMIADGVPRAEAERCGPDCVYWRNPAQEWRIMTIAPDAPVILRSYPAGVEGSTEIGLARFTRIFDGTAPQNDHLSGAPYRLTMSGGEVTGIEELRVSW